MTVYTVYSIDDPEREPLARCVAGSYTTRGRALDECVGYIMGRIEVRNDLAWSMAHDYNHPGVAKFFSERREDGVTVVRRGYVEKLREFLRDELGRQSCYYIYDGGSSWHFDIDESDVVGELWHTVTWGDSDCEDPQFTTPWPETFTSQETAIETFVDYVDDLVRSRSGGDFGIAKGIKRRVRKALKHDGQCQYDLNDGCCVSCVLYHDDAKNVRE